MTAYDDKYSGKPPIHAALKRSKGCEAYYRDCRMHYGIRTSVQLTAFYLGWSTESVCRELGLDACYAKGTDIPRPGEELKR